MTSIIYKFTNNNYDGLYFLKGQIISSNLIADVFVMEKCSFRQGPRQSTFNFGNKEILFVENNVDYALDDYDTYIVSILNSLPTPRAKTSHPPLVPPSGPPPGAPPPPGPPSGTPIPEINDIPEPGTSFQASIRQQNLTILENLYRTYSDPENFTNLRGIPRILKSYISVDDRYHLIEVEYKKTNIILLKLNHIYNYFITDELDKKMWELSSEFLFPIKNTNSDDPIRFPPARPQPEPITIENFASSTVQQRTKSHPQNREIINSDLNLEYTYEKKYIRGIKYNGEEYIARELHHNHYRSINLITGHGKTPVFFIGINKNEEYLIIKRSVNQDKGTLISLTKNSYYDDLLKLKYNQKMWRDYDKWIERYRIPKLDKIVVSYIFTIKKSSIKILETKDEIQTFFEKIKENYDSFDTEKIEKILDGMDKKPKLNELKLLENINKLAVQKAQNDIEQSFNNSLAIQTLSFNNSIKRLICAYIYNRNEEQILDEINLE